MKKDEKQPTVTAVEVIDTGETAPVGGGERLRSFMQTKYPDKSWADDNEFYGGVADYLEQTGQRLSEYEAADEKILNIAKEYPEVLAIVNDMAEGKSIEEAIARNIDIEDLIPANGEPDFEKYAKARDERKARLTEAEAYRVKLDKNMEKSREILKKYFEDHGMSDEEAVEFADYIDGIASAYLDRAITPEILDAFNHARNYDTDIAEARTAGEAAGKNAKIDAERQKTATATDGLPSAGSSAGAPASQEPAPEDLLDEIIASSQKRRSW